MSDKMCNYAIYMLRRLSPSIFGETYVITTGTEITPGQYSAEYFILMERPTEALHIGKVVTFGNNFPAELGNVDVDFAMAEASRQAEIDLLLLLEARANVLGRPDLAYQPFELELRSGALLSIWCRGRFTKQLMDIKETTKCPKLAFRLGLLQQDAVGIHVR